MFYVIALNKDDNDPAVNNYLQEQVNEVCIHE